jgi:hypothetical protein
VPSHLGVDDAARKIEQMFGSEPAPIVELNAKPLPCRDFLPGRRLEIVSGTAEISGTRQNWSMAVGTKTPD